MCDPLPFLYDSFYCSKAVTLSFLCNPGDMALNVWSVCFSCVKGINKFCHVICDYVDITKLECVAVLSCFCHYVFGILKPVRLNLTSASCG
jgi:hypothetical protein